MVDGLGLELGEASAAEAAHGGETHMRLTSAMPSAGWTLRAPQPTGSSCRVALSKSPAFSVSSVSSPGILRAGSKPLSKRWASSVK